MFTNVIWATDGSERADRALPYAAEIAQRDGAALHVVHVVETIPGGKMAGQLNTYLNDEQLNQKLARQISEIAAASDITTTLHRPAGRSDHVARRIVDIALETGGDLIVVGTHGHSGVVGALVGSVTQDLLHLAPCPVLAVPPLAVARAGAQIGSLTVAG